MNQPVNIRVFLSSPGDVADERAIAIKVIDQLKYDAAFKDNIKVEVVAWDKPGADTPLLGNKTPQEAILEGLAKPSQCDIVVVMFWSRIGTPLSHADYKKPDGSQYLSGTEWEYWDAYEESQKTGSPQLLIYRRVERKPLFPDMPDFMSLYQQWQQVDTFFARFNNSDGSIQQGYNQYRTPDDFRQKFESHIKTLILRVAETKRRTQALNVTPPVVKLWQGSPFPGLRAFTTADAPIFFGRGRETDALLKKLNDTRFIAVVGASGSGKSSLVGAGLIPRLKANAIEGSKDWHLPWYHESTQHWDGVRFTPAELGDNPFIALAAKLAPIVASNPQTLAEKLETTPSAIAESIEQALQKREEWSKVLVFVDQFEELFTTVKDTLRTPFIHLLHALAQHARVIVVLTMRSDFYHRCVDIPDLSALLENGSFPLSVPTDTLLDMIVRPAERAGLTFDEGLSGRILLDVGKEPGALALMAYALDELYQACKGTGKITFSAYDSLGGVQGAIRRRAESTFDKLSAEAQEAIVIVFRELVNVEISGTATRQRVSLTTFDDNPSALELIRAFINARLLVSSTQRGQRILEVAHESLLRSWPRLADWIDRTQDDLRLLRQVRSAAAEWQDRKRPSSYLWQHERLQPVYEMQKRLNVVFNEVEREFLRPETDRLFEEFKQHHSSGARESLYRQMAVVDRFTQIGAPSVPTILKCIRFSAGSSVRKSLISLLKSIEPNALISALDAALDTKDADLFSITRQFLKEEFDFVKKLPPNNLIQKLNGIIERERAEQVERIAHERAKQAEHERIIREQQQNKEKTPHWLQQERERYLREQKTGKIESPPSKPSAKDWYNDPQARARAEQEIHQAKIKRDWEQAPAIREALKQRAQSETLLESVKAMMERLSSSPDYKERYHAAEALATHTQYAEVCLALDHALNDVNEWVRLAAVRSLSQSNNPDMRHLVVQRINDSHGDVQSAARAAYRRLSELAGG